MATVIIPGKIVAEKLDPLFELDPMEAYRFLSQPRTDDISYKLDTLLSTLIPVSERLKKATYPFNRNM